MENGKFFLITSGEIENGKWKMENGKWKMKNGKLFLALALGTIDREAEQRAALFGGNGWLGGLPRLVAYANQNAPRISARGATYYYWFKKD